MFVFAMVSEARRYFDTYVNRRAMRMSWAEHVARMGRR
jgi:hypothetical protein